MNPGSPNGWQTMHFSWFERNMIGRWSCLDSRVLLIRSYGVPRQDKMNLFSLRLSYSRTTLVVAASLIVLAVSAYVGPRASITQLAPIVGVIGLLILLRNPELGLIVVLISAMTIPITIGTGTQTKLNMAIILIPALLLLWIVE